MAEIIPFSEVLYRRVMKEQQSAADWLRQASRFITNDADYREALLRFVPYRLRALRAEAVVETEGFQLVRESLEYDPKWDGEYADLLVQLQYRNEHEAKQAERDFWARFWKSNPIHARRRAVALSQPLG